MSEAILLRTHSRARRLSLRLEPRSGRIVLTRPRRVNDAAVSAFIARHQEWITARQALRQNRVRIGAGDRVALEGESYLLVLQSGRGTARLEDGRLILDADADTLPHRLVRFLRQEAERRIRRAAQIKTEALGVNLPAVRIRDPKTRWGSCGGGGMMFSWRLILMPPVVMDYIVAHEVAHLRHRNHGPDFHALCRRLAVDADGARRWLKAHGTELMMWGAS